MSTSTVNVTVRLEKAEKLIWLNKSWFQVATTFGVHHLPVHISKRTKNYEHSTSNTRQLPTASCELIDNNELQAYDTVQQTTNNSQLTAHNWHLTTYTWKLTTNS